MGSVYEEMEEEEAQAKEFSFYGMWEKPERDALLDDFKGALNHARDAKLEQQQREQASSGKIMGVNWLGVEAFIKEAGLLRCRHPMAWIIKNVVKPICADAQCELVELFFGVQYDLCPVVAPANWFFSYTWSVPFQETVQTMRSNLFSRNADEDPLADRYFWWDCFCQNQHVVKDVQGTFDSAITQVSDLGISIPNPAEPNAVKRIWCLFEVMSALDNKKPVTVFVNHTMKAASQGNIPEIDARNAGASVESDKEMILGLVESRIEGGIEGLNSAVFKALRDGLVQAMVMQAALQQQKAPERKTDAYQYLNFSEIKKLLLKSDKSEKAVVKSFIKREDMIAYAEKKGIEFPSEEKVKELKKAAAAKTEGGSGAARFVHAKRAAVTQASWI